MRNYGVAVIGVVAFMLCSGAALGEEVRHAQILDLQGDVSVKLQGGEWQTAELGMMLQEKDEVRTAKGGFAEIVLDGGEVARLELKEGSLFRIDTMDMEPASGEKVTLLDLAIGRVLVHAEKLHGDSKFEVRTPTSTTGVRGTEFEVSVREKE